MVYIRFMITFAILIQILLASADEYQCFKGGNEEQCCNNSGNGPICKDIYINYKVASVCRGAPKDNDIPCSGSGGSTIQITTKAYQFHDSILKKDSGTISIFYQKSSFRQITIQPYQNWISSPRWKDYKWYILSQNLNIRNSPDSDDCTIDGSAYGSVDLKSIVQMETDTEYDEYFCIKFKFYDDTEIQSSFFRVRVTADCSGFSCAGDQGKGQFIFLENQPYSKIQFQRVNENQIPMFEPMKLQYSNQCCIDVDQPGQGIKFQLSLTNDQQTDVPAVFGPIYDDNPYENNSKMGKKFELKSEFMYVPAIYKFYVHVTASALNVEFYSPEMELYVACGHHDPNGTDYQQGRTNITLSNDTDTTQFFPSLEQTTGTMPNPRWGFRIPKITSSNEQDCKIWKITNSVGKLSWNVDYSDYRYKPSSFWETDIALSSGPEYATIAENSRSSQKQQSLYLLLHIGTSLENSMYLSVQETFTVIIGCFNTGQDSLSKKSNLENYGSSIRVVNLPIADKTVFTKFQFTKFQFQTGIDFCNFKQSSDGLKLSNLQWWDENNILNRSSCDTDEQRLAADETLTLLTLSARNCYKTLDGYPFFGEEFVKIDYESCTSEECPLIFNRILSERIDPVDGTALPIKFAPFYMDHDITKYISFSFTIKAFLDSSNNNFQTFYYNVTDIKCTNKVNYTIESSLLELNETERKVMFYADDQRYDSPAPLYQFDSFQCEPHDCCKVDYVVLKDVSDPTSVVDASEVEVFKETSPGKNTLLFKNYDKIYNQTYYISAKTSSLSTGSDASNMVEMDKDQLIAINASRTCNPSKVKVKEGGYRFNLTSIQETKYHGQFVLPNLTLDTVSDKRCNVTYFEILDENGRVSKHLLFIQQNMTVRPLQNGKKEFNFTVRATIYGGYQMNSTNQTFRYGWIEEPKKNETNGTTGQAAGEQGENEGPDLELIPEFSVYDAFADDEEFLKMQSLTCEEAIKYKTNSDNRLKDGKPFQTFFALNLLQKKNSIQKFDIMSSFEWPFKKECTIIRLQMLCGDDQCQKPLTNPGIFLLGDKLMIDRSETFNGNIYLQILDKVSKDTYVVSMHLDVLEMVPPGAFATKKLDEDSKDNEDGEAETSDDSEEVDSEDQEASEDQQENELDDSEDAKNDGQDNSESDKNEESESSDNSQSDENGESESSGSSSSGGEGSQSGSGSGNGNIADKLSQFLIEKAQNKQKKKKRTEKSNVPVLMKLKSFNHEGVASISFNQNIETIFKTTNQTEKSRRLGISIEPRDLFQFSLVRDGQNITSSILDVIAQEQLPLEMKMKFVFEKKNEISTGFSKDKLSIRVNPQAKGFFRSQNSDLVLDATNDMEIVVPKQMFLGITQEEVQEIVKGAKNSVNSYIFIQIGAQFFLKQGLNDLITLFFLLQMIFVLSFYNFQSPAVVDIVLEEFKNVLTFKSLKPDYLLGLIEPGLTVKNIFMSPVERFQSSEESLVPDFLIFFIVALAVLFVLGGIVFTVAWFKRLISHEKLIELLIKQKNVWIWNRIILSFFINFTFQAQTAVQFMQKGDFGAPLLIYGLLLASIGFATLFILTNAHRTDNDKFIAKHKQLYQEITLKKRGKKALLYYPIYFLKRWLLVLVILITADNTAIQMNMLLNLNVFGIIAYGAMRSHDSKKRRDLEFCNESMILVLSYTVMCMSDFNQEIEAIFYSGLVFVAIFMAIIVGNFGYTTSQVVERYQYQKKLDKLQEYQKLRLEKWNKNKEEYLKMMALKVKNSPQIVKKVKENLVGKKPVPFGGLESESLNAMSAIDEQDEIMQTLNESDLSQDMKQDVLLANYNKPYMKTFDMGVQISFGNSDSSLPSEREDEENLAQETIEQVEVVQQEDLVGNQVSEVEESVQVLLTLEEESSVDIDLENSLQNQLNEQTKEEDDIELKDKKDHATLLNEKVQTFVNYVEYIKPKIELRIEDSKKEPTKQSKALPVGHRPADQETQPSQEQHHVTPVLSPSIKKQIVTTMMKPEYNGESIGQMRERLGMNCSQAQTQQFIEAQQIINDAQEAKNNLIEDELFKPIRREDVEKEINDQWQDVFNFKLKTQKALTAAALQEQIRIKQQLKNNVEPQSLSIGQQLKNLGMEPSSFQNAIRPQQTKVRNQVAYSKPKIELRNESIVNAKKELTTQSRAPPVGHRPADQFTLDQKEKPLETIQEEDELELKNMNSFLKGIRDPRVTKEEVKSQNFTPVKSPPIKKQQSLIQISEQLIKKQLALAMMKQELTGEESIGQMREKLGMGNSQAQRQHQIDEAQIETNIQFDDEIFKPIRREDVEKEINDQWGDVFKFKYQTQKAGKERARQEQILSKQQQKNYVDPQNLSIGQQLKNLGLQPSSFQNAIRPQQTKVWSLDAYSKPDIMVVKR